MILLHLRASWPRVLSGEFTSADATLSEWADLNDENLQKYADTAVGIYQNAVVSAFDVDGWSRTPEGKVVFTGHPSTRWASLIGTPNPGKPWVRGMARPVQYLDTRVVLAATGATDPDRRSVTLGGFTLSLGDDGNSAVVIAPSGASVTVQVNSRAADLLRDEAVSAAWGLMKGGDLDMAEDGKAELLRRIGILETAEAAGIHIDREGLGVGEIYTREEIHALP